MVLLEALMQLVVGQSSLPASFPVTELPADQALAQLVGLLGGLKGATALGIAVAVTQAVMLFFRTPLANFAGKWKLTIVSLLSCVATYLGLVSSGASWGVALLAAPFMAAIQVLASQFFLQFKKDQAPTGEEK